MRRLFPALLALLWGCTSGLAEPRAGITPAPAGFEPPDAAARAEAVGPVEALPPALQAAFDPGPPFDPMPTPRPRDWLAHHNEAGQTYAEYLASDANRPDATRHRLYLLPVGALDGAPDLNLLADYAGRFFGVQVALLPPVDAEALGASARPGQRPSQPRQLHAGEILSALVPRLPDDAWGLVALTMEDLYPGEGWNFVFGYASLTNRVGVYSFARYDPRFGVGDLARPDTTLLLQRSIKVMTHEIGHMLGLAHCVHFHCLMNGSNNLTETDRSPTHLGPACLRKLHHATGVDPARRYTDLAAFYTAQGLDAEAAFARRRLAQITAATGANSDD